MTSKLNKVSQMSWYLEGSWTCHVVPSICRREVEMIERWDDDTHLYWRPHSSLRNTIGYSRRLFHPRPTRNRYNPDWGTWDSSQTNCDEIAVGTTLFSNFSPNQTDSHLIPRANSDWTLISCSTNRPKRKPRDWKITINLKNDPFEIL